MWKLIEISQQSYFINFNFTSSQEVTLILYDLKETWCKSLSFSEVKQNVKLLNKRYDFNEADIRDTLLNGEIQTATLEQQPHTSSTKQESCVVKLKYIVKNCPFHLEWSLRRQTLEEFQSTFMQPLFTALLGCFQQVEILSDILRKKDVELTQYRKEGAVLHRKTLATKTFDFDDFTQKYKVSTELAENYTELAKFVINTKPKVGGFLSGQPITNEATKEEVSLKVNPTVTNYPNAKISPKQRKRKIQNMKQQQLERRLKISKQQFEYESSQSSQTTNSSNNQNIDKTLKIATEQKDLKDQQTTPKKDTESENVHESIRRQRIARCAPIRNYEEHISGDDKTDSDDESNKITSRHRKSTRKLNTAETGISVNSIKCKETIDNTKRDAGDICYKTAKSPTLSYNSLKKSTGKSLQNLNKVYDFSTDSEYEKTTKIRNKFLKTCANMTENRKTRSSPLVFTEIEVEQQRKSSSNNSNKSKNFSHSSTPVSDDISSQLDAIKKELESLEALRLADLQQRMCKA